MISKILLILGPQPRISKVFLDHKKIFFFLTIVHNNFGKKYYILPTTSPYTNPSTCVANSNFFYVKKWCVSGNQLNAFGFWAIVIVESENYNTIVFETPNKTEVIIDAHYLFGRRVALGRDFVFLNFLSILEYFLSQEELTEK